MIKSYLVKLWRLLGSIKLAVVLILLLSIISVVGTFIPQEERAAGLVAKYGQDFFEQAVRLGVTDLYHSKYFVGIALLFFLNLLVCTIQKIRNYPKWLPPNNLVDGYDYWAELQFKAKINSGLSLEQVARLFKKSLYRVQVRDKVMMAQKNRFGRYGFLFVHVGLMTLIIGMIVGGLLGDVGGCFLYQGIAADNYYSFTKKKDIYPYFQMRLDDFDIEYYPPKIMIGARFDGQKNVYVGGIGDGFTPAGTNYTIIVKNLMPDVIWERNKPIPRSPIVVDPAVHLVVYQAGELVTDLWLSPEGVSGFKVDNFWEENLLFLDLKAKPRKERALISIIQQGKVVKQQEIAINWPLSFQGRNFYLTDYNLNEVGNIYVKLQLSRDPGMVFFWLGSLLLLVGVIIAFYFPHKRYFLKMNKASLLIGATTSRGKINLKTDFAGWLDKLKGG